MCWVDGLTYGAAPSPGSFIIRADLCSFHNVPPVRRVHHLARIKTAHWNANPRYYALMSRLNRMACYPIARDFARPGYSEPDSYLDSNLTAQGYAWRPGAT